MLVYVLQVYQSCYNIYSKRSCFLILTMGLAGSCTDACMFQYMPLRSHKSPPNLAFNTLNSPSSSFRFLLIRTSLVLLGFTLRPSILDLGERFEASQGWASERIFSSWLAKQEWRGCLPSIYEYSVERVAFLIFCCKSFSNFTCLTKNNFLLGQL